MVHERMLPIPLSEPVFRGSNERENLVINHQFLMRELPGASFVVHDKVPDVVFLVCIPVNGYENSTLDVRCWTFLQSAHSQCPLSRSDPVFLNAWPGLIHFFENCTCRSMRVSSIENGASDNEKV